MLAGASLVSISSGGDSAVRWPQRIALPTRDEFVKGPGMILKGNPGNNLTEIQLALAG